MCIVSAVLVHIGVGVWIHLTHGKTRFKFYQFTDLFLFDTVLHVWAQPSE